MPYGYVILSLIGVIPISEMYHIQRESSALLVLQRWAPLSVGRATSTVSRLNQNKNYNLLIFSNISTETL